MFGRGRREDEDPFAALREGGTYQSASPTTATPRASSATSWAPAAGNPPRRRWHWPGLGTMIVLRIAFAAILAGVAIAVPLIVTHSSHSTFSIPSFSFKVGNGAGPVTNAPTPERSYLTPAGVRAGLRHVEELAPHARLSLLRVDARSLSATAILPHGVVKQIYFGPTGSFVTTGASTSQHPVPISRIRPTVIGRLLAQMRHRFHVPPSRIDYIVLSSPPGLAPHWILFSKAHSGYSATLTGGRLTKLT